MKNQTYLVRVNEINDNMTLQLLDYGTVEILSDLINLYVVKTFTSNKDKLLSINGVLSVENQE